jgi:phospholipid/cholesterol/gamma-HCH transport system substrate-binding protein
MRATSRHFKLGMLAILGSIAVVIAILALGLSGRDVVRYHTYFDESVHGLEKGAIVKFRGVRIGKVSSIKLAPDARAVDVELAIDAHLDKELHLERRAGLLRTRLVLFGITGVKLIDIDLADPNVRETPEAPGPKPQHYIRSRPSLIGSLEAQVSMIANSLPKLVDETTETVVSVREGIRDVREGIGDAQKVMTDIREALAPVARIARSIDRRNLPHAITTALTSVDEVGRNTTDLTNELEDTVRDVGDAARAMRDLVEAVERQPDMLLKGRARPR